MFKTRSFFVCLLLLAASFFLSCESENIVTPVFEEKMMSLPVFDYSDYHYFFDSVYFRSYVEVMSDSTGSGVYSPYVTENAVSSTEPELWIQCDSTESSKRLCVGLVTLGPMPAGGYDDTIRKPENILGEKCFSYFRRLRSDEFYYNRYAGFTGLIVNAQNLCVGVVYTTADGRQYGAGEGSSSGSDTLVLKLIKTEFVHPTVTPGTWRLMMKNVYRVSPLNITSDSKILLQFLDPKKFTDTITGYNSGMLTMLKLDRFTGSTLNPPPDGKFDWRPGLTVHPSTGDIFFPVLKPFSEGLIKAGVNDSLLLFDEIYSNTKYYTQTLPKAVYYWFRIK